MIVGIDESNKKKQDRLGHTKPNAFIYVLGLLFCCFFLLYSFISVYYSLKNSQNLTRYTGIFFQDIRLIAPIFLGLLLIYFLFYAAINKTLLNNKSIKLVIYFSLIFIVILMSSAPFMSTDLYSNIIRSEIIAVHKINPYRVAPAMLGYENIAPWPEQVQLYGPLFTVVILILQKVGGLDLAKNMLVFRLFNVLLLFMCALFIYKIIKKVRPQYTLIGVALFLWNPYILLETVNNGHNDIFLAFFILTSVYFIIQKKYELSAIMLIGGFLVKFSSIVLLPIPFIMMWFRQETVPKKMLRTLILLTLLMFIVALFNAPFGSLFGEIRNLNDYYYNSDQFTLVKFVIRGIVSFFATMVGQPQLTVGRTHTLYLIIFFISYALILFYRRTFNWGNIIKKYFWILFIMLQLISMFLSPWYYIWLMPLLILIPDSRYRALILIISAHGFIHYIFQLSVANTLMVLGLIYYYLMIKIVKKPGLVPLFPGKHTHHEN